MAEKEYNILTQFILAEENSKENIAICKGIRDLGEQILRVAEEFRGACRTGFSSRGIECPRHPSYRRFDRSHLQRKYFHARFCCHLSSRSSFIREGLFSHVYNSVDKENLVKSAIPKGFFSPKSSTFRHLLSTFLTKKQHRPYFLLHNTDNRQLKASSERWFQQLFPEL